MSLFNPKNIEDFAALTQGGADRSTITLQEKCGYTTNPAALGPVPACSIRSRFNPSVTIALTA